MYRIILIASALILSVQCCEIFEEEVDDGKEYGSWFYLLNVTELGKAAINSDVDKLNHSLTGRYLSMFVKYVVKLMVRVKVQVLKI